MRLFLAVAWRVAGRALAWACYRLAWCMMGAIHGMLTPLILLVDPPGLDRTSAWITLLRLRIEARLLPPPRGGDGSL